MEIFLILLKKIILVIFITFGMDHSIELKKKQLRKKLNKKRADKGLEELEEVNDDSIFNMINQVNKTLKENPEMVKKISKCINNVFDNKDLMSSLISEVETNIVNNPGSDSDSGDSDSENQILETSTEKELPDASENDSKQ
jgi:hypothetical protein